MKLPPLKKFPRFRSVLRLHALIGCSALGLFAQPIPENLNSELDPLGKPTGRLSHPVLLIHGWADNATAFGVELAEPICRDPVVQSAASSFDAGVLKSIAMSQFGRSTKLHLRTRMTLRCSDGWEPQVERIDQIAETKSFGDALRILNEPITSSAGRTRVGNKEFLWSNWAKEFEGRKISEIDSLVGYRVKQAEYRSQDLLMGYTPLSIPDVLARSFQLSTRWDPGAPRTGINRNGIYAFHAKDAPSLASEICRDALLNASRIEGGWRNTGEIVRPETTTWGVVLPELSKFEPVLIVEGLGVECLDPGRKAWKSIGSFAWSFPEVPTTSGPSNIAFKPFTSNQWRVTLDARNRTIVAAAFLNPLSQSAAPWSMITRDYSRERYAMFPTSETIAKLAPYTHPGWPSDGQAKQLFDRIRQVMDHHYGSGQWETNPTAQIDLIAHSQGGLVTRAMLADPSARADLSLSNPINHIRRVVTLGTPHFGTAISTPASFLQQPQSALRAELGQRPFPVVANLKSRLLAPSACTPPELVRDNGWGYTRESIMARLQFFQSPPSACLVLAAKLGYTERAFAGLYSDSKAGTMYLTGPITGPWTLSITGLPKSIPDKQIGAEGVRTLLDRFEGGSHLGWPQSSPFIEDLLLKDASYPRYPGATAKIPFYTFHSPSVGSFGADLFRSAVRNLKEGCPVPSLDISLWKNFGGSLVYGEQTIGSMTISCRSFHNAMDEWLAQAESQFAHFDADWSTAGDMVVEEPSQRGVRKPADLTDEPNWDPTRTPEFTTLAFKSRTVFHGTTNIRMAFDNLDPKMTGVSWHLRAPALDFTPPSGPLQGCDIATRGLGISSPSTCPPTLPFRDLTQLHPVIRTKPAGLPSGAWGLVITNPSTQAWKPGWSLELPVVASTPPSPTLEGGNPPVIEQLGDRLWAARWTIDEPVPPGASPNAGSPLILHPGPTAEFLESTDDAADSIPHLAAVRTLDGTVVAGADLSGLSNSTPANFEVRVSRGNGDQAWLRPMVEVRNNSLDTLHAATIRFRLPPHPSGAKLEAALWNAPWPSNGQLSVQTHSTGEWIIDLRLTGFHLPPGATMGGLQWGAHWDDWSLWNEPILPESPSEVDWAGGIIIPEETQESSSHPATQNIQASIRRDNSEANLHRLRLKVTALTASTGFTLRLPLEIPAGISPVLESWWPVGCIGHLDTDAMILSCPDAQLSPDVPWPDGTGAAIGLHDTSWQAWPRGTTGITAVGSEWTKVGL